MTTRPELLELLHRKETETRDRLQEELQTLQERLARAASQLGQLQEFRVQYQERWQGEFRQGTTPELMQCYAQFMARLDTATVQQKHTVQHVQGMVQRAQERLLAQEVRLAGIEKMQVRQAQRLLSAQERADQRLNDEWAQRAHRLTAAASPLAVSL